MSLAKCPFCNSEKKTGKNEYGYTCGTWQGCGGEYFPGSKCDVSYIDKLKARIKELENEKGQSQ